MTDEPVAAAGTKKMYITIGVVVVALLVIGGIQRAVSRRAGSDLANRIIEQTTGGKVNVDSNGGTVTVKTEQGTVTTSDKLPDGFPTDVPLYPGAKVTGSVAGVQDQKNGAYVGMESADAFAKVRDYYKTELVAKGWKIDLSSEQGGTMAIFGASKGTVKLTLTISQESEKTVIAIGVGTE
jgi:hypothetical protein